MDHSSAKINFFSLFTALILFLLPWTNVTCAGQRIASQSGLQAAYGGVSESGETKGPGGVTTTGKADTSKIAGSALVAVAGVLVIFGLVLAGRALLQKAAPLFSPGVLSGAALILIAVQAIIGFPIGKGIDEIGAEARRAGISLGKNAPITIERTPWFWLELVLLAVPVAVFWNERRKLAAPPEPLKPAAEVQRD